MMSVILVGPEDRGMPFMQPFIDSGPLRQNMSMLPWNRLIKEKLFGADAFACMKGGNHSVFGLNIDNFDVATYVWPC